MFMCVSELMRVRLYICKCGDACCCHIYVGLALHEHDQNHKSWDKLTAPRSNAILSIGQQ